MPDIIASKRSAKIVFFGTLSLFSNAVLSELLHLKIHVSAIVIAKHAPVTFQTNKSNTIELIQASHHKTIEMLALEQGIPVIYAQNIYTDDFYKQVESYHADFIVVACFPQLIPRAIWELPRFNSLNVHPSLLPEFQGPYPIFWQLKSGAKNLGVTIHKLNDKFDQGEVMMQKAVSVKQGLRGRAIERLLAKTAAPMLQSLIRNNEVKPIIGNRQAQENSSYFPIPQADDFRIRLNWTAKRAFNFMRGTEEWNRVYPIDIESHDFFLTRALAYTPESQQTSPRIISADNIRIRFSRGVLQAKFRASV